MATSRAKKVVVPLVVALALVAVVVLIIVARGGGQGQAPREAAPDSREVWRCSACATITGKNWQSCRTVTGRGTEKAASDLVRQRVCEEAANPATQCTIGALNCRRISGGPAGESADTGDAGR